MPSVLKIIAERNAAQRQRVVEGKKGETIDVPEGTGLLITGCSDCTVSAPGRSSNVTLERCDGTTLRVGRVVASLEVICCSDVKVSVERCRTITVDTSTDVAVSCECQASSDSSGAPGEGGEEGDNSPPSLEQERKTRETEAADEASAIRLFTSASERVSITFEGLLGGAVTYGVPKDCPLEKGNSPRSVSRITVDRTEGGGGGGGGGTCKTLRCDHYGIPLEEIEAAAAGEPWTWEHGKRQGV